MVVEGTRPREKSTPGWFDKACLKKVSAKAGDAQDVVKWKSMNAVDQFKRYTRKEHWIPASLPGNARQIL